MAALPSLSLLCWFVPSVLFLIFQVETGATEEEGVTSFQRFMMFLAHLECGLGFRRPPRTELPPPVWALGPGSCPRAGPLSEGQIRSQLAVSSPVTPVASCPCRAPGFRSHPPHPAGRPKLPLTSPPQCSQCPSPGSPVPLPVPCAEL